MLFDWLIKIVERDHPQLIKMVDDCKIFDFYNTKIDPYEKMSHDEYIEHFLPFNNLAIEDETLIILSGKTNIENVITIMRMPKSKKILFTLGEFFCFDTKTEKLTFDFKIKMRLQYFENKIIDFIPKDIANTLFETGFNQGMYKIKCINSPQRFILEERPLKIKKSKKLLRTYQRPKYTILSPTAIREKLKIANPTGKNKIPHERRRHIRFLRDKKYSFDSNGMPIIPQICPNGFPYYKTTIIPPTWVGQKEKIIKNKIYKVRLDI